MIEIKEVKTKRDFKVFIRFPNRLYSGNKYWIPSLEFDEMNTIHWDKNPAFEYCEAKYWLAYKDERVAGRIAVIVNHKFVEVWNQKDASFGWVDFIDDEDVSRELFNTAELWAKEKGMERIHGPFGFTGLDKCGILIKGFEELGQITTTYNYPYYSEHVEKLGYEKEVDWVEYEFKVPDHIPEKLDRISKVVLKRSKLKIVDIKKSKDLLPYAKGVFELLNDAYKDLFGSVELTEKQIDAYIKQYFGFVNPDYIRVILDKDDKIAAFGIAMPSLAKAFRKAKGKLFPFGFIHILKALKKNDSIDLYLVAVRPDLQGRGINSLLMTEVNRSCIKNKIVRAESGAELESNSKVQAQWKHFDARQHKRRRCYIKSLN